MDDFDLRIWKIPIFRKTVINEETVKGIRSVLLGIIPICITYGTEKGDHIHISIGIFAFEIFAGVSIWKKFLP